LEELCGQSDPTNPEVRKQQKDNLRGLFAQAYDVPDDVEIAFNFWDAVSDSLILVLILFFAYAHLLLACGRYPSSTEGEHYAG
jgi:hypothetical protein